MSTRTVVLLLAVAGLAAVIVAVWIAGSRNSQNYYLRCGTEHITAKQGRFFLPWGEETMQGPAWQPIEFILPTPQCEDRSFDNRDELALWYRRELISQAERWLEALRPKDSREHLDTVHKQLEQALLLSRASDQDSVVARQKISRLAGDVEFWRARTELDAAQQQLGAAAERLQAAVDKKPMHAAHAEAWQSFVRGLQQELDKGPPGLGADTSGPADSPRDSAGQDAQTGPDHDGNDVNDTPDQPAAQGIDAGVPADAGPDAAPGVVLPPTSDAAPPPSTTVPGSGTLL